MRLARDDGRGGRLHLFRQPPGLRPGMPGVMALPTPNPYRRPQWADESFELDMLDLAFENSTAKESANTPR